MEVALNQPVFLTLGAGALRQINWQAHGRRKIVIKKARQVAHKWTPLGAHLAVNTHYRTWALGGIMRLSETVESAGWSRSLQESRYQFKCQIQIKGQNLRRWQERQNWTDSKLTTKLTQDDQQLVLSLPARSLGGLTSCQNLKMKGVGKGHKSGWRVGSVTMASSRIQTFEVANVMGVRSECSRPKDWTAWFSPTLTSVMHGNGTICKEVVWQCEWSRLREFMTDHDDWSRDETWKQFKFSLVSEQMGFLLRSEVVDENKGEARLSKQWLECNDKYTFVPKVVSLCNCESMIHATKWNLRAPPRPVLRVVYVVSVLLKILQ